MAKVKPQEYVDNIPAASQDIILPTRKPSGTAPSNYGTYINAPTSPTYVSSAAAANSPYIDRISPLPTTIPSGTNGTTYGVYINNALGNEVTVSASQKKPKSAAAGAVSAAQQNNKEEPSEANLVTGSDTAEGGGTPADTDATVTATTVAAPSPVATNDSYLNFLNGQAGYLDAAYKAEKDRIDEETRGLLAQIETKRQRAVVDADSAYELNKATHGTQAERLASMGLTGSGYSDHLESRAYAASRGEVQAANASALAAENEANLNATNQKLAAGVTYQNGLRESEAQRAAYIEGKFDSLNTGAATGVYSQEQLNAYADYYGFDNSKRDVLSSSANAYQTALAEQKTETEREKEGTYYTNYMTMRDDVLMNPSAYSDEVIDKGIGITYSEKEAAALKADRDAEISRLAIETIDTDITSGNYADAYEAADVAYENKFIDANAYQSKNFEIVLTKCKSATTSDDVLALEAELENLRKAGKISGADKTAGVQYLYENAGNVLNTRATSTTDTETLFDVVIDGETYSVNAHCDRKAGAAISETLTRVVNANGKAVSNGVMAEIGGTIYMYRVIDWGGGDVEHVWVKTKPTDEFYNAYMKQCSYQGKPTVPKHTA